MMRFTPTLRSLSVFILLLGLSFTTARGQTATGTISGRVDDAQGLSVPGVTVSATSPNLQGARETVTSLSGNYVLPLLPPGLYTLTMQLEGFAPVIVERRVAPTERLTIHATLEPADVEESVTVSAAQTDMFVGTVQSAAAVTAETMDLLPTERTLTAAIGLAAGVATHPPFSGFVNISGATLSGNLFLLDGVQVSDNIRNTPIDLFIEDAIQEVTVATSGISAEHGRFTGGMVNAVTRSGGNAFSGSFRTTLRNDDWRTVSPFDEEKIDDIIPTYEYTLGGPIVRDKTWFFAAGRATSFREARTLFETEIPYEFSSDNKRFEGKLTQALGRGHHLKVRYTGLRASFTNSVFGRSLDTRSFDLKPLTSEGFLSTHYTGAVSSTLFLEGQVSVRQRTFLDTGGLSTDRIEGTRLFDVVRGAGYWAPPFCAVCTDEERDSTEVVFKGTSFVPTRTGSHTLVFGYDLFNEKLRHDNHQTASDFFVVGLTSRIVDDVPNPVMIPGHPLSQIIYRPILESSRGTNFRTHALFVNDTWNANDRLTFNLGVRWDKNDGQDAAGNTVATGSRLSPRFGVVWDPRGDGRWAITGNYSQYTAAISTAVGQSASAAGRPAGFAWTYRGPPINVDPTAPLVPTDEALRTVFDWFDSVGGVNLRPYRNSPLIPGVSTQFDGSVGSPYVVEYGSGVSRTIGSRGAVRADVTYRDYRDFYAGVTDLTTGRVTNNTTGQTFDLQLIRNSNDFAPSVRRPLATGKLSGRKPRDSRRQLHAVPPLGQHPR